MLQETQIACPTGSLPHRRPDGAIVCAKDSSKLFVELPPMQAKSNTGIVVGVGSLCLLVGLALGAATIMVLRKV